ncbi:MAG: gfo/Idh/MocA family oxidoreductase, partial [Planctomycetales bacterium]|nr:gfo/Idh/MocA family oxidoreductase [Planctomycetales bacterium]
AFSPCSLEATHPDLYWYGIHGVETLYAVMGTGCESVRRTETTSGVLVTARWSDDRQATLWALSTHGAAYSVTAFGDRKVASRTGFSGYQGLVREIAQFFETRQPPVAREETTEMFAFMEAVEQSKRRGGVEVGLSTVLTDATRLAEQKFAALEYGGVREGK